ncbi:ribosome-associated translation inhibitor RaiA [Shewanella sp. WXL01]|uniref:Ribosome hibernation promoting factor n=1 Tax=Shewanella maritima TaxID=2520507 RepID=A0A411PEJ2_9GAMM|nr:MULTISPECIES: ribosome-associated translation inhibitor RaiA [Shewanella]NKF49946.1 ribosome-associated translation inhibitor RaiA [Shewanella sp. WXL01]QBF81997.1 ribosome-associated translation inhibitor RaiA [Shewanella maritima]
MKINLSGHHVDVTDSVKQHVDEKFAKIASHFPTLISLDVTITKEHGEFEVEVRTNYEGASVAAKGTDPVMWPAIAAANKKLDAALKHRKGQLKADKHAKPDVTAPEIAYEKVQEMNLN